MHILRVFVVCTLFPSNIEISPLEIYAESLGSHLQTQTFIHFKTYASRILYFKFVEFLVMSKPQHMMRMHVLT